MDIGLALPHYDFSFPDGGPAGMQRMLAYAIRADDAGFESVWISDHLFLDLSRYGGPAQRYASLDPFVALSAVASATRRVRMGTLVACTAFRPAPMTANVAAGLHALSGGRFELGLGAGWYQAEFDAMGIPFGTAGERLEAMAAATRAIRADLNAREGAAPPVFVGGKGGPRVMRIVAECADGWNIVWRVTPVELRERLDTLARACERTGRNPDSVTVSIGLATLVGSDRADVERRYERYRAWAPGGMLDGVSLDDFARGALVGTPDECAAMLKEFQTLGVTRCVLSLAPLPFSIVADDDLDLVASELLPAAG